MSTPSARREAVQVLVRRGVSQRKACRYLGLSRRVTCYALRQPDKDQTLGVQLIGASQDVPRFGYRRMAALNLHVFRWDGRFFLGYGENSALDLNRLRHRNKFGINRDTLLIVLRSGTCW
jgi:hypothetical protein